MIEKGCCSENREDHFAGKGLIARRASASTWGFFDIKSYVIKDTLLHIEDTV
jgi:hypothetical protein